MPTPPTDAPFHSGGSISCPPLSITTARHQIGSGRRRLEPSMLDFIRTSDGYNMWSDLMGVETLVARIPRHAASMRM